MRRVLLISGVMGAISVVPTLAFADQTIDVTGFTVPNNINAVVTLSLGATTLVDHEPVQSGQIALTVSGSPTPLFVWCTDDFHTLTDGTFSLGLLTNDGGSETLSTATINRLGWLMNNYTTGSVGLSGTTLNELSSATQLAIWSVEYTSVGYTFAFTSDDDLLNQTLQHNGEVSDLIGLIPDGAGPFTVDTYTSPGIQAQSFIAGQGNNNFEPVPEPASMALLGAGLFGLGLVRRKRAG